MTETTFAGKRVVFTGEVPLAARAAVAELGATVETRVTRETDMLVVGANPGSRLFVAQRLGTRIVREAEFLALLEAARAQHGERYTLDGEPIDFAEFLSDNREAFSVVDAERFSAMRPGEEILIGGGAAASFCLRRVA